MKRFVFEEHHFEGGKRIAREEKFVSFCEAWNAYNKALLAAKRENANAEFKDLGMLNTQITKNLPDGSTFIYNVEVIEEDAENDLFDSNVKWIVE